MSEIEEMKYDYHMGNLSPEDRDFYEKNYVHDSFKDEDDIAKKSNY